MKHGREVARLLRERRRGLVHAERLRRAAEAGAGEGLAAAREFARFAAGPLERHFREEETLLFPLLARHAPPPEQLARALVEHAQLRALAGEIEGAVGAGTVDRTALGDLGMRLAAHVGLEERELFPLIDAAVPEQEIGAPAPGREAADGAGVAIADLAAGDGPGPVWGTAGEDLNATLLAWPAGEEVAEHVNHERDVLLVVTEGSGTVRVDGAPIGLAAPQAVMIRKGSSRRISAAAGGLRYVSIHLRRPGLQIESHLGSGA